MHTMSGIPSLLDSTIVVDVELPLSPRMRSLRAFRMRSGALAPSFGLELWYTGLLLEVPQARGCEQPHPSCGSKKRTDMPLSRTAKRFASRRLSEAEDIQGALIATTETLPCGVLMMLPELVEIQMTCMPYRVGTTITLLTRA